VASNAFKTLQFALGLGLRSIAYVRKCVFASKCSIRPSTATSSWPRSRRLWIAFAVSSASGAMPWATIGVSENGHDRGAFLQNPVTPLHFARQALRCLATLSKCSSPSCFGVNPASSRVAVTCIHSAMQISHAKASFNLPMLSRKRPLDMHMEARHSRSLRSTG
jgi:hypothetical protein